MSLAEGFRRLGDRLTGRGLSAEEQRLIELFRNRAELKKELATLDEERSRLLDRLKLQEGATIRVEEQLDALEQYLGRPEEGAKCLAHYQLRAVWRAASRRLQQFSTELARQQKDRERKQQLATFERDRRERLSDVDRELVEARVLADQLQAEQKLAQQKLATLQGFWHYLGRRRLQESIEARRLRIEASLSQVAVLEARRRDVEAEQPPAFPGVSLEGRRAVNLAVIACADWLAARLAAGGVAQLARQGTLKRVYDASYGSRDECAAVMQAATRALQELERSREDLADIKTRAERLRAVARYRGEGDAVPVVTSLHAAGTGTPGTGNVLADEYFEIYRALLP